MIISAWSSTLGIVLGVKESKLKKEEGEKRATEELLEKIYLKGAIITLDANGATPRITEKINERKGDYIIGLKDNQRQLKKLCIAVFDDISNKNKMETFKTIDKGHGRKETRRYDFLNLKKCSNGGMPTLKARIMDKWKSLGGFCKVTSTIERNGRTTTEVRYYFSSLKKNVKEIGDTIRAHWSVENTVHWTLDVTFREDYSRARIKQASANLAVIRRMALNMLKKEPTLAERSMRRKRKMCGWDLNYLEQVLWGTQPV